MKIHRNVPTDSVTNPVIGDLILSTGDLIITDKTKGIIMDDDNDDTRRTILVNDGATPVLEIGDAI